MSILDKQKLDFIGTDKKDGHIILSISDHLDWKDESEHLQLLQDKINIYLAAIESGEIYRKYQNVINKKMEIFIYFKYTPSENAKRFILAAKDIVKEAGFDLNYKVDESKG
jgi:hypothetical protein